LACERAKIKTFHFGWDTLDTRVYKSKYWRSRSHHLGWMKTTKTDHQMHRRRWVSKVSAPIPPSTPDRKQQQRRTQRQFCYCNRGTAAMECAMTWLGNNRMMQSVTWNSNHTDDDAVRFQAYMRIPSSNAIATRIDRSYYPDYSTRPQIAPPVSRTVMAVSIVGPAYPPN
jgi:hypothetical protein